MFSNVAQSGLTDVARRFRALGFGVAQCGLPMMGADMFLDVLPPLGSDYFLDGLPTLCSDRFFNGLPTLGSDRLLNGPACAGQFGATAAPDNYGFLESIQSFPC